MKTIINEDVLAHGIVIQAAKDYLSYRRTKEKLEAINSEDERHLMNLKRATDEFDAVVRFFKSDWYKQLCNIDGDRMLEMLDKEYHDRQIARNKRKIRKPR